MIKQNILTKTYKAISGDAFSIDIVIDGKMKSAWLYHDNYSAKLFMFGYETDENVFVDNVKNSLDNYIPLFWDMIRKIES